MLLLSIIVGGLVFLVFCRGVELVGCLVIECFVVGWGDLGGIIGWACLLLLGLLISGSCAI